MLLLIDERLSNCVTVSATRNSAVEPPANWKEARRRRAWELFQKGRQRKDIAEARGVSKGAASRWVGRASAGRAPVYGREGGGAKQSGRARGDRPAGQYNPVAAFRMHDHSLGSAENGQR